MEAMSNWTKEVKEASEYFGDVQAKYFEYLSLEGEKIGQMSEELKAMFNSYETQNKALIEKQGKLFNI